MHIVGCVNSFGAIMLLVESIFVKVASTDRMDYLGFNTGYTAMKAPTYAQ